MKRPSTEYREKEKKKTKHGPIAIQSPASMTTKAKPDQKKLINYIKVKSSQAYCCFFCCCCSCFFNNVDKVEELAHTNTQQICDSRSKKIIPCLFITNKDVCIVE